MRALLDQGFDSAAAIIRTPRTKFLQDMEPLLGGLDQTEMVYAKAQQTNAAAANTYAWLAQSTQNPSPAAVGQGNVNSLVKNPDWEKLFGSL